MEDSENAPHNCDDVLSNAENEVNGNIDASQIGSTLDNVQMTELCSTENTALIDKEGNEVDSGPLLVVEDYELSNYSPDDSEEYDDARRDEFRQSDEQAIAKAILKKAKNFDRDALPKSKFRIYPDEYVHHEELYEWEKESNKCEDEEALKGYCDIAWAVLKDDAENMKKFIVPVSPLSERSIQCRILQAAEQNSLKCLEVLCEMYEKAVSAEYCLFRPCICFTSGVLIERPKETALHVLAAKTTSVTVEAILEVFERKQKFLNDFSDFPDGHGSTPLLVAIKHNNMDVVKRLLRTEPRVDKINDDSESPILLAALNDYAVVIKEMLETYRESQERSELLEIMKCIDDRQHSILYPASLSGKSKVLNLIMKETDWGEFLDQEQTVTEDWNEFVGNVCAAGCEKLARECFKRDSGLLGKGGEPKVTPLMRAAKANQERIVRLIFEMKPSDELFNICDKYKRNVFHYAVGNVDALRHLVLQALTLDECEAIRNPNGRFQCNPIKFATIMKQKESLALLVNIAKFEMFREGIVNHVDIEILKQSLDVMKRLDPNGVIDLLHGYIKDNQPFLSAARHGNVELMKFLLQKGADPSQIWPGSYQTAVHLAVMSGKLEAVEYLLEQDKFLEMIDRADCSGITAAVYATQFNRVEILKYLLKKNAQIKSGGRQQSNILDSVYHFKMSEESMKKFFMFCLKHENPRLLYELFEDSRNDPDDIMAEIVRKTPDIAFLILDRCIEKKNFCLFRVFTYWFFPFIGISNKKKLQALERMTESPNADKFLRHPLVVKFLNRRMYSSSIQKWFLLSFFIYTMFLITLTTYGAIQSGGLHGLKSPGMIALSVIILILCGLHLVKEISQMIAYGMDYMRDLENIFELTIFISAVIYVVPGGDKKNDGQIIAGAISIFLAWVNFSQFLKTLFNFGVYIFMAIRVFETVCMVLPMVILFLVGFSLSFSLIMHQDAGFTDIPTSFLTTLVMMTGELDYSDTFLANGSLHAVQKIFLVLFILMISIAIMNLFTGVAVGDVKEMLMKSKERRRINKAKLVIKLERGLSFFSIRKFNPECECEWRIMESFDRIDNLQRREERHPSLLTWIWEQTFPDDEDETMKHEEEQRKQFCELKEEFGQAKESIKEKIDKTHKLVEEKLIAMEMMIKKILPETEPDGSS
ncbi:transient receptor potential cation channel subfamily A member 1-like [Dendronephthya gigantea]|uniref:transient receptor potential cation channel subfamily A member 1-like n=1 Tax=Dendronephthya gigantea TaxID=151771 RepID=UPI00106C4C34|nr:transient receptor potential cation channel subfamily A member 1-like [Dendronephthya gigantea]XP_028392139.1 transient receptor potential cation channel subfamily A member 1-like [Dendronephthya gigantea]XP_028392140.1 transient receptor potential cation channel subfamily A member 1-like [Dendronephthya gigantea]